MILDTNAVSGLLAGDHGLAEALGTSRRHHLPVVVIAEYRYGLLRSRHRRRLETLLEKLIQESIVLVIDEGTSGVYVGIRDELSRAGTPIPANDLWIAALARQHGETVVSRDEHFDRFRAFGGWPGELLRLKPSPPAPGGREGLPYTRRWRLSRPRRPSWCL